MAFSFDEGGKEGQELVMILPQEVLELAMALELPSFADAFCAETDDDSNRPAS